MDLPSQFLAIAGLILGLLLLWYNIHRRGNSAGISPPEPSGAWPVIGHFHLLTGKVPVYKTLGAMADKVGPVFMIRLGMYRAVVVSNHEGVKDCFTTNDKAFATRPTSAAAKLLGYNYAAFTFAPYGPYWREMRKLSVLEILSARRLTDLMPVQVSELEAGIKDLYMLGKDDDWGNPKKVVLSKFFEHLVFNVVLRMITGRRCFNNIVDGSEEAGSSIVLIKKLTALAGASVASDAIPFLEFLDIQGHLSSMKHFSKKFDSVIENWVEEHKGRVMDEVNTRQDFIDVMLSKVQDASINGYSRDVVIKATVLIREEDEEIEADGANYQLEMMRCLREVNVDNNTVGWYQSTLLGSFQTVELIETFMNYQENIRRCVCIIYDPSRSNQGVLALKALKLSDSFMELYRNNNFTGEKLREKNLSWVDIFEEIPIKVSNSALISAFMTELEADTPVTQCDYDRLQLSTGPYMERNLEFLIECMDDLSMEQQKFQFYYRNLSRQQAQQQAWLQKRRAENMARKTAGEDPLPEEDPTNAIFKPIPEPSRLDNFLITNQISNYCNQINGVAGQSFSRLYLMKALHEN